MITTGTDIETTASKLAAIPQWQEDNRGIIGRRRELHGLTVALASRGHVLLYGPPGVAKSMTVDGVLKHVPDLSQFKTQAYKASPPEQFIGPISMKGLAEDEMRRITAGKAPDVNVFFCDETPRAPRAVLPVFQGMMVEREFDAGDGAQPVPLMSMIGTANHLLEDDSELNAFFDRFVLKFNVRPPQSQDEFKRILRGSIDRTLADPDVPDELLVGYDEMVAFQEYVPTVRVPDAVLDTLAELWSNLLGAGIELYSMRRYTLFIVAMQAQAAIEGRDEVLVDDIQLAQHSLWTTPAEEATVFQEVNKFASSWVQGTVALLDAMAEIQERFGQVQALVASGSKASDRAEIADSSKSLTDHAIDCLNEWKTLVGQISSHKDEAAGRDTSQLDAALTQVEAGRDWVSDRILGGLRI
jgi:MoxR-like ATPase